jgi:hypothetical protein
MGIWPVGRRPARKNGVLARPKPDTTRKAPCPGWPGPLAVPVCGPPPQHAGRPDPTWWEQCRPAEACITPLTYIMNTKPYLPGPLSPSASPAAAASSPHDLTVDSPLSFRAASSATPSPSAASRVRAPPPHLRCAAAPFSHPLRRRSIEGMGSAAVARHSCLPGGGCLQGGVGSGIHRSRRRQRLERAALPLLGCSRATTRMARRRRRRRRWRLGGGGADDLGSADELAGVCKIHDGRQRDARSAILLSKRWAWTSAAAPAATSIQRWCGPWAARAHM